jgi:hypothetical protein
MAAAGTARNLKARHPSEPVQRPILPLRHKMEADALCLSLASRPAEPVGPMDWPDAPLPNSPEFLTNSWGYIRGDPGETAAAGPSLCPPKSTSHLGPTTGDRVRKASRVPHLRGSNVSGPIHLWIGCI